MKIDVRINSLTPGEGNVKAIASANLDDCLTARGDRQMLNLLRVTLINFSNKLVVDVNELHILAVYLFGFVNFYAVYKRVQ